MSHTDFAEFLFHALWVNKPSRAMRQGSSCGMLGGASRFLYPPRMKSWLQFAACGVSQI